MSGGAERRAAPKPARVPSGNRPSYPAGEGPTFICFGEALTDLVTLGADDFRALPGGAGLNVARAVAALGIPAAWAGCLSEDRFGDQLFSACVNAGLDTRFIRRLPVPPLLAVVDSLHPPHYFFLGEGAADLQFNAALLPTGWREGLQWAHFGGISLVREPLGTRLEALAHELKAQGVRISFDPNHRQLMTAADLPRLLRFFALADAIKVSDEDLRGYFPAAEPADTLARLRGAHGQATWLYTRGADGASLWVEGVDLHAPARPTRVVDTVGAGDASMAGLLAALMLEEPPARQLQFALTNASLACEGAGAAAPTRVQLLAALS